MTWKPLAGIGSRRGFGRVPAGHRHPPRHPPSSHRIRLSFIQANRELVHLFPSVFIRKLPYAHMVIIAALSMSLAVLVKDDILEDTRPVTILDSRKRQSHAMRTIQIDPNFADIASFGTAHEAISSASHNPNTARAREDSIAIAGLRLSGFSVTDPCVCLEFEGGRKLELIAAGRRPDWRIVSPGDGRPCLVSSHPDPMQLTMPNGRVELWDPARLLQERRQSPFGVLEDGQGFLNLCFQQSAVLQFFSFWNVSDQSPFLYFSEVE
jgi:hypothetical protein